MLDALCSAAKQTGEFCTWCPEATLDALLWCGMDLLSVQIRHRLSALRWGICCAGEGGL